MKIFHLSILTPNEVYTSAIRIYNLIKSLILTDPFITKLLPKLKKAIEELLKALGRTTDSAVIELLHQKDITRDTRFIAFRDYCDLNRLDTDPAIAAAARTVVDIIRELGWSMQNEGLAKQTSLMDALIQRLETAPASAAIATLKATERFADMKAAHLDFEFTNENKVDAKTKTEFPKIRDSRIAVTRYLLALISYMDIMAELDGAAYAEAQKQIDETIVEFETMAHNRQTKNKPQQDTPPKI